MKRYALLGPAGTYSEEAAHSYWNGEHQLVFSSGLSEVFTMVLRGEVDGGLVPLCNSRTGSIGITLSNLLRHEVYIAGEVVLPVSHCLMAARALEIEELELLISQPEVFLQCTGFLNRLPHVRREIVTSTSQAAAFIKAEGRKAAAIGSRRSAHIYGLQIIAEALEDDRHNCTTFINITREPATAGDKTTIIFGLDDVPGALYRALEVFARREINLSRLESRPRSLVDQGRGYMFYVDIEGGLSDPRIKEALQELSSRAPLYRCLGSYPSHMPRGRHRGEFVSD